jgi:hypothetical protein
MRINPETQKQCRYRYDVLRGQGSAGGACEASEVPTVVATTEGPSGSSSSKPKQRNRKGGTRETSLQSTGANSGQAEDASRETQARTRNSKKKQTRRQDCEVPGANAGQSEVNSQLAPAESSKNSRPRARPLNRMRGQKRSNSGPSLQPQNVSQVRPAVASEAAAGYTVDSFPASPPGEQATSEDSREDRERLSRKRRNTTSRSDSNDAAKRQKTSGQLQAYASEATDRHPDAGTLGHCKYV